MNNQNDLIYSFNVFTKSLKVSIVSPKQSRLCIYPDKIKILKGPFLEIKYEDINSIYFKKGTIVIVYAGGKYEFVIPSTLDYDLSDSQKSELFVKLVISLKNNVDIATIIKSLRDAERTKSRRTQLVSLLILSSIFCGVLAIISLISNNDIISGIMSILFFICLISVLPVTFLRSRKDIILRGKLLREDFGEARESFKELVKEVKGFPKTIQIEFHYSIAEAYLEEFERDSKENHLNEALRDYYYREAINHIEKLMKLAPTSEKLEKIRKKLSNFNIHFNKS